LGILKTIAYADSISNVGVPLIGKHCYVLSKALERYSFKIGAFTDTDLYGWKQRMGLLGKSPVELLNWLKKTPLEYKEPSLRMRMQFEIAFNISPMFQEHIEHLLSHFEVPDYARIMLDTPGDCGFSRL